MVAYLPFIDNRHLGSIHRYQRFPCCLFALFNFVTAMLLVYRKDNYVMYKTYWCILSIY